MANLEYQSYLSNTNEAFTIEYNQDVNPQSLYKDVESYLGEYRFLLTCYNYQLLCRNSNNVSDNYWQILDPYDKIPMTKKAQKAIGKRQSQGKNISREQADLQGVLSLEQQINFVQNDDTIIWISPPGQEDEGYGDYGFFYVGKITPEQINPTERNIIITAIRIEKPTINQCNQILSRLKGKEIKYTKAEEFIANPLIISKINLAVIQNTLSSIFIFSPGEGKQQIFNQAIETLKPIIHQFIKLVQEGKPKEILQKAFYALENYAIQLKTNFDTNHWLKSTTFKENIPFDTLINKYGYSKPPPVSGSCGSTNNSFSFSQSPNIFNLTSILSILAEINENFICPSCHKESTPPVGNSCPQCGITKEEAAEQGLTTC